MLYNFKIQNKFVMSLLFGYVDVKKGFVIKDF